VVIHVDAPLHAAVEQKLGTVVGHNGAVYGRLLSTLTFDSPPLLPSGDFSWRVIESEYAFPVRARSAPAAQPLDRDEIADALAGVMPGIEIVDSRFHSWTTIGANCSSPTTLAWSLGQRRDDYRLA